MGCNINAYIRTYLFSDDSDGKLQSQLQVYVNLLHVICNSILLYPETMTQCLDFDKQVKGLLKFLKDTTSALSPLDVSYSSLSVTVQSHSQLEIGKGGSPWHLKK